MNTRKSQIFIAGIILLSFIVAIYFYPKMPGKVASHWNAQGKVDGYMSKFWGLFLMPFISAGLFLFFVLIPKIDPLKTNIERFRKYYDGFVVLMMLFLFYLYLLTILWNIEMRFNIIALLAPAFGILFFYTGILIENAKRNWFIGIRTPWTLSSEEVWEKTNKLGGRLFKIAGIVAFLGVILQKDALYFILVPVLIITAYTVIYSYLEWQKATKY